MAKPFNELMDRMDTLKKDLEIFANPQNQHAETAKSVSDFVEKVFNHVNKNSDIPAVNQILADSLLEIRRYVLSRNTEIDKILSQYNTKLTSYQECVEILLKHAELPPDDNEIEISPQPNETIASRISAKLDKDGNLPKRTIGSRPEKLKEVRKVQEKLKAGDILKKDN
jgi:hypothetical protein